MSRRAFFEVASALLGVYFIVSGFSALPMMLNYPGLHEASVFQQLLIWGGPVLYVLAGLCLISKSRTLASWLFTLDEAEAKNSGQTFRLSQYFEVGVRLLGLYYLVGSLPSVVRVAVDVKEAGLVGLEIRSALSTILWLVASLVMLLKSGWLAGMLYADADSGTVEPSSSAEDPDGSASES